MSRSDRSSSAQTTWTGADSAFRKAVLDLHLSAISESQKRARVALFLTTLASAAILIAEWNSYFSWDRQWAELEQIGAPRPWAREQLLEQQIKSWLETNAVNVSAVGLRVSVSDAAVLGSIILLVAAFYLCMTTKRENFEIASALREAISGSPLEQRYMYVHIQTTAVFERLRDNEEPIADLFGGKAPARRPLTPSTHKFLIYLPAFTIFAIILTDAYFAFGYSSPWSGNYVPGFTELPLQFKIQLIAMDAFAFIYGCIAMVFCRFARRYQLATQHVIAQFRSHAESATPITERHTSIAKFLTASIVVGATCRAVLSLFAGHTRH